MKVFIERHHNSRIPVAVYPNRPANYSHGEDGFGRTIECVRLVDWNAECDSAEQSVSQLQNAFNAIHAEFLAIAKLVDAIDEAEDALENDTIGIIALEEDDRDTLLAQTENADSLRAKRDALLQKEDEIQQALCEAKNALRCSGAHFRKNFKCF